MLLHISQHALLVNSQQIQPLQDQEKQPSAELQRPLIIMNGLPHTLRQSNMHVLALQVEAGRPTFPDLSFRNWLSGNGLLSLTTHGRPGPIVPEVFVNNAIINKGSLTAYNLLSTVVLDCIQYIPTCSVQSKCMAAC